MSDITCRICLSEIKQDPESQLCNDLKKLPLEQDMSITDNPVPCNKCKKEVDDVHKLYNELHLYNILSYVKEEIKQEVVEEGIVKDECVLFNTDIPSCIEKSTSDKNFYCYQCNYGTNDKKNLTDHIFAHRFKCNQCSYATPDNYSLMKHEQTHRSLKCSLCNYSCIGSQSLAEHTSTHSEQSYTLTYKTSAINKNQLKLDSKNEPLLGDFVSKRRKSLKIHMIKHSGEQPLRCDKCNYKTNFKYTLARHKGVHSKAKPFKCHLCDFCTKRPSNLKRHIMIHSGEQLFRCDKCDYKTNSKYNLARHKGVHSKAKPFKCNLCDFCTKCPSNLKKHIIVHYTGEQLFSCNKCEYKTNFKTNLLSHIRVHTEEKSFKCNFCNFCSKHPKSLKVHMMKHSGG